VLEMEEAQIWAKKVELPAFMGGQTQLVGMPGLKNSLRYKKFLRPINYNMHS